MKKLLLTLSLLGSPALAQNAPAETYSILYTSHVCDTYENIVGWINAEVKEELLFRGVGTAVLEGPTSYSELDGVMHYFVNQNTGTWTMLYVFDIKKACIMATGINFLPHTD